MCKAVDDDSADVQFTRQAECPPTCSFQCSTPTVLRFAISCSTRGWYAMRRLFYHGWSQEAWNSWNGHFKQQQKTRTETQLRKASLPFMVWAAQRRLLAEPCIIHENVEGFDPAVLVQLLGDMYLIFSVFCELMRLGIPCRRKRRITILVHKHRARATVPWDYKCIELCERHCALTFNNFKLSRRDEFHKQLNWASIRDDLAKDSEYKDDEDVKDFTFVENLTCTELLTFASVPSQMAEDVLHARPRCHGCSQLLFSDRFAMSDKITGSIHVLRLLESLVDAP